MARCALCGSEILKPIFEPSRRMPHSGTGETDFSPTVSDFGIFYRIVECRNCGICFSLIDDDYSEIRDKYSVSKDAVYTSQSGERSAGYRRIISRIKSLAPENARLLDIGASYGLFLNEAKAFGFRAEGIELSEDACRYCRDILRLDILCADIKDMKFDGQTFDIITAIEVIEHLNDPGSFIDKAHSLLKKNGIIYLATPDIGSFTAKIFGRNWWSYRRMHIYYFSKATLSKLLYKKGFSVVYAGPYKKTFKIDYIAGQLSRSSNNPLVKFAARVAKCGFLKNISVTLSCGDIEMIAIKI